ncbi:MAG: TlpA family protein disulfide reductase [Ottowia sp.]|nr:TlpA family protein disulfide reductase [Ottowia sp.]
MSEHIASAPASTRLTRRTLLAACAGALLTGCGEEAAPASQFVLLDGSTRQTSDFLGQVLLLNFWATSCTTCVAEMPQIVSTYRKFQPRGFQTRAVAMSHDKPEYVVNFAKSRQLPFLVAFDASGAVARAWGDVRLTPTSFLVDKRGRIARRYLGQPDFAQLHAAIEKLLA